MAAPNTTYNWSKKKLWNQTPTQGNFNTTDNGNWVDSQLAPYTQDWNKGYDAIASEGQYAKNTKGKFTVTQNNAHGVWQKLLNRSNANFCNMTYYVPLFVNAIQIDLGITGSTAQARLTRDFYPHNITIPMFNISGQCYSTAHYGSLIEYIHMAQHESLNSVNKRSNLIQFYLKSTEANAPPAANHGLSVIFTKNAQVQKIVGGHGHILCQGYINTISRTSTTGDHRPTWQAQFVVSQMISSNIFEEQVASEKETGTWLSILAGTHSQNWLTPQNESNNKKTLASVLGNTSNVTNSIQGSTS